MSRDISRHVCFGSIVAFAIRVQVRYIKESISCPASVSILRRQRLKIIWEGLVEGDIGLLGTSVPVTLPWNKAMIRTDTCDTLLPSCALVAVLLHSSLGKSRLYYSQQFKGLFDRVLRCIDVDDAAQPAIEIRDWGKKQGKTYT